jgi:hypothetical protein
MTNSHPIACSLSADDFKQRLAEIGKLGGDSLTERAVEDGRHVLRFRADAAARERLNAIVAAEADCCSFLDLGLSRDGDELVLTIAAPDEAQPIADGLALAFAAASR